MTNKRKEKLERHIRNCESYSEHLEEQLKKFERFKNFSSTMEQEYNAMLDDLAETKERLSRNIKEYQTL